MKRPPTGGKGLEGVIERGPDFDNPAITALDSPGNGARAASGKVGAARDGGEKR